MAKLSFAKLKSATKRSIKNALKNTRKNIDETLSFLDQNVSVRRTAKKFKIKVGSLPAITIDTEAVTDAMADMVLEMVLARAGITA